jgi:hypothetical protein
MKNPLPIYVITIGLLATSVVWLRAAPSIGTTTVTPNIIGVDTPTQVRVTAQITDPSLLPTSVNLFKVDATGKVLASLGRMYDDGTNGDVVAGDHVFGRAVNLNETHTGEVWLQVSAGFKGMLRRLISAPIVLSVWISFDESSADYTLIYPATLPLTVNPTKKVVGFSDTSLDRENSGLWIYTVDNPKHLSPIQWWATKPYYDPQAPVLARTLAGASGIEITVDPDGLSETHIVLPHGNKLLDILILGLDGETADAILSTLALR